MHDTSIFNTTTQTRLYVDKELSRHLPLKLSIKTSTLQILEKHQLRLHYYHASYHLCHQRRNGHAYQSNFLHMTYSTTPGAFRRRSLTRKTSAIEGALSR